MAFIDAIQEGSPFGGDEGKVYMFECTVKEFDAP